MPIAETTALLAAGGLSAASSILGSGMSAKAAREAMEVQRDWERERAKNAHQWEVQDLKAAGLNPIISAGGSGATTGGISAPMPDYSGVSNAVASAAQVAQNLIQSAKTGADTKNVNADTKNKQTQNALIEAQTTSELARAGLISEQEKNTRLKNISEKIRADNADLEFWNKQANTAASTLNNLAGVVGNAIGAKKALSGLKGGLRSYKKSNKQEFLDRILNV